MSMELFGIFYVVFGLMAVIGAVLDADGVMAAIRRLPTRWMDHICETMYKFIMEHRSGLLMKIVYNPHVDTTPKDRLYQIDFRIDEADVERMQMLDYYHTSLFQGQAPVSHAGDRMMDKFICDRVRQELLKSVVDFASVRASYLPYGGVAVNAQLVCRRPKAPQFAWAEKCDFLRTENRFE